MKVFLLRGNLLEVKRFLTPIIGAIALSIVFFGLYLASKQVEETQNRAAAERANRPAEKARPTLP